MINPTHLINLGQVINPTHLISQGPVINPTHLISQGPVIIPTAAQIRAFSSSASQYYAHGDDRDNYYQMYQNIFGKSTDNQGHSGEGLDDKYKKVGTLSEGQGSNEVTLTHIDSDGKATMVDVGRKPETRRLAIAQGYIELGRQTFNLVKANKMKKGDVLSVAQIAGIMAVKNTANLIPLCHNIPITKVDVRLTLDSEACRVMIESEVLTVGKTGVEMEALMGVTVAALTVYDMCKAISHDMVISDVKLIKKTGGQRGDFSRG